MTESISIFDWEGDMVAVRPDGTEERVSIHGHVLKVGEPVPEIGILDRIEVNTGADGEQRLVRGYFKEP